MSIVVVGDGVGGLACAQRQRAQQSPKGMPAARPIPTAAGTSFVGRSLGSRRRWLRANQASPAMVSEEAT